ncbi:MAG: JDVT-CTERM domain-containing protein [Gammaproteobacteria bacterium]
MGITELPGNGQSQSAAGESGDSCDVSDGGGGCTLNRVTEQHDPLLPVLLLLAAAGLGCRRLLHG